MQNILYILAIPFLYINYKIIISDIKYKKIPNKYLLYLLYIIPFYYIYLFTQVPDINGLLFISQIFIGGLISFILYYFGIWAAGDAKYLLVLTLFIPNIGIIPFIGNIAFLTLIYLLLYFIWFYFGKCLFYKGYAQSLWKQIKTDLLERWKYYKQNRGNKTLSIILKWLLVFLILFVSIRLSRIYIFTELFQGGINQNNFIQKIIEQYNIYLFLTLIILFVVSIYIFKKIFVKIKEYISIKFSLDIRIVSNMLIIFLFITLISFILFELVHNYNEIKQLLYQIFTLYLLIYIVIKILIYSYKLVFGISETEYIHISQLKEGDIIDKQYLIKMFGSQKSLGAMVPSEMEKYKNELKKEEINDDFLYIKPHIYFIDMDNIINKANKLELVNIYKVVEKYHLKNRTPQYQAVKNIKILKTFSFGPYILIGFIITHLSSDFILTNIFNFISK